PIRAGRHRPQRHCVLPVGIGPGSIPDRSGRRSKEVQGMSMRRQLIATIFGFSALGFALLALIYWLVILQLSGMDRLLQIFLIAAIISFSIFLLATPEAVGKAASKRSNKLTVNALVASAVALAIAFTLK